MRPKPVFISPLEAERIIHAVRTVLSLSNPSIAGLRKQLMDEGIPEDPTVPVVVKP